ncbi:MAG: glutamine synthetase, partial [Tidjanibacter sp.]|nr:glutamine synthetase [Tidjanibacter sp.]
RYVGVNIFHDEHKAIAERLEHLPDSCAVSADALEAKRAIFEEGGVFSASLIDGWLKMLRSHNDANLREELQANPDLIKELVDKFINVG